MPPRTPSEEQWLRISDYLSGNRYSLAVEAAREYPDDSRLAGTPLLLAPGWRLQAPIPLASIRLEFSAKDPAAGAARPSLGRAVRAADPSRRQPLPALLRRDRVARGARRLREPADYRLVSADLTGDEPRLAFAHGRFFEGINVGGPAAFEYAAAALGVTSRRAYREAFGDPTNLHVRSSAMATCALTLRYDRRTGTATFPMHYRDPALVGHAGGLYQVIPVGIFQPSGEAAWNEANDFDLWRGLLREYAEELLGASEEYGSEDARSTTRAGRSRGR